EVAAPQRKSGGKGAAMPNPPRVSVGGGRRIDYDLSGIPTTSGSFTEEHPMQHTAGFAALAMLALISGTARADRLVLVAGGGTGSDGPAKQAKLQMPFGVDVDHDGNLYLVEFTGSNRVRRVDPKGNLTTIAGTGEKGK